METLRAILFKQTRYPEMTPLKIFRPTILAILPCLSVINVNSPIEMILK